ncbi:hypothetical protein N9452_03190 [Alphaproteobacteria bacterium]|jgi:hypothetical protein|nr:hypothetical protein [Alphaproteobacteria bacterium]
MRIITTIFSTLFLITAVPTNAGEFLTGFDDVPVMRGMAQVQSQDLVFDSPGGRIVEGYVSGSVTRTAVRRFYRSTLPQLGWERLSDQEFSRDGEKLQIGYTGQDGDLTVRFTLTPNK